MNRRAEVASTVLIVLGIAALVSLAAPKVAPSLFDKRTREANQSAEASKAVEEAVAKERAANERQGAVVAASVVKINEAAREAPLSPYADFIARESSHVLPLLPAPDYKALYAAEARKRAVLEGRLEQADKLYAADAKERQRLLDDNAKLRAKLAVAFAERRDVDTALAASAAFQRGKDFAIAVLAFIVVLCVVGWIYARLNGINTRTLGMMSADIRAGHNPQEVIDRYVPVRLWRSVKKERKRAEAEDAP